MTSRERPGFHNSQSKAEGVANHLVLSGCLETKLLDALRSNEKHIIPQLNAFSRFLGKFSSFFKKQNSESYAFEDLYNPDKLEIISKIFVEVVSDSHISSLILSSEPYGKLVQEEKILRGEKTTLGISKCIDGRLSTLWAEGRATKAHETMAGILETDEVKIPSPSQTKTRLKDARLTMAIMDEAERGPLLEILLVHTDLSDPDHHGCGAMKLAQSQGKYVSEADLVLENIKEHDKAAQAIDTLYNEKIKSINASSNENEQKRKEQKKTAITAVYDTLTMGVLLGYETKDDLPGFSTTDIAIDIDNNPTSYLLTGSGGPLDESSAIKYFAGAIRNKLSNPQYIIENETLILGLTKVLLGDKTNFYRKIDEYIKSNHNLSQLSVEQQKALRFYLARTTAVQFLSKSYEGKHPYIDHDEKFQSVSTDGDALGQFMPEQVFCASPDDGDMIKHIITQTAIMRKNNTTPKNTPYILFVAGVLSTDQDASSSERARADQLALYRRIIGDKEIRALIMEGSLLPIPVMINAKTRDLVEVGVIVKMYC